MIFINQKFKYIHKKLSDVIGELYVMERPHTKFYPNL